MAFLEPPKRLRAAMGNRPCRRLMPVRRAFTQQATCQFCGRFARLWLRYCMAPGTGADVNDVNDVPSLSEPYGPDVAMAYRGRGGAEISQSGAAGRLRQVIWPARRFARTDLALLPHLSPACLRHRHDTGRQSGAGGDRGGYLRDPVRLAAAFQEGERAGAAAAAAGGADVRPFRHPVARHREDTAAGPRRLHHRLA